jgi:hypothetical protein
LRDELSRDADWVTAGNRYAEQHRRYCSACYTIERWMRTLFQDPSPEAAALRQKAMPLIAEDATRVPDNLFSGHDLPVDEDVRARLFGER